MRKMAMAAALAALTLGACSKEDGGSASGDSPQSAEEVASQMAKVSLQPGEWETTSEIVEVTMDNMPQGMPAGMLDAMKGRKTTVKSCITPEQAENPEADFLTAQKDGNCTYSGFEMAGGTIRGNVSCTSEQGGTANIAMEGIYSPASYAMTMNMNGDGMGGAGTPGMTMQMKMKTSGKRIGECKES